MKTPIHLCKHSKPAANFAATWKRLLVFVAGFGAIILTVGIIAHAQSVPQPVIRLTPLGSDEYKIAITNGVSFANYELYHTPVLADAAYPWTLAEIGTMGKTNFFYTNSILSENFFQVTVGLDWDGDGIDNWLDGDPSNTNTLTLDIFIDSPVNGTVFN